MEIFLFLFLMYLGYERYKKVTRRMRRLEKQVKGENVMSQLVKNLVNQEVRIHFEEELSATVWTILAVDEDWLEIERVDKKGNRFRELVRIDDIKNIELEGVGM